MIKKDEKKRNEELFILTSTMKPLTHALAILSSDTTHS